tara:strand:+ start:649 stop:843 length:195 start_codon:yes stop_codon:yes gene_type:complete
MNLIWLLRLKRWVQRPPSRRHVWLILGVIAASLVLFGIEYWFGWPEWLTPDFSGRGARLPQWPN